ncbi:hypothetical protein GHT06_017330 [Daphnia sinensis]|uniref:Uncharacterized protein n=1 Tax=Daphnia sinensis TaxID=1820382 RepID=A0AAD5KPQ4_9CRUS|nr:hypothetical protein GHT06_017330 [Daphnia sinensis]
MELLELEMRARAIKALLKKEEEGQGDDEWPDDVVGFDAQPATPVHHHRPLKTGEDSSSSYTDKHKQSRHAGHQHRPSVDPVPPTHSSRRPAGLHQQTDGRRDRHSSAKQEDDQGPNQMRQQRHYRHRHHERSRSPVRRAEPSSVVMKTEEMNKQAAKSPSRSGRVKERRDNAKGGPEKCDGTTAQVASEDVEYEEEGIQEVDIELGSGSDDDANSARL